MRSLAILVSKSAQVFVYLFSEIFLTENIMKLKVKKSFEGNGMQRIKIYNKQQAGASRPNMD